MKNILIITGETSGDQHGAKLVRSLNQLRSDLNFYAVGGDALRKENVNILVDNKDMGVVGAIEILAHFGAIFKAWQWVRKFIKEQKPDLVILIDYPGFNLHMAKFAKKKGIKVVYYISPQVWAWKQYRVKTIRKYVDQMLVIFPFEESFYQQHQVPVTYVGHPLAEQVIPKLNKTETLEKFNLPINTTIIGLLPGSRKGEVKRLLPTLIQTAEKLNTTQANLTFVLPLAPSLHHSDIQPYLKNSSVTIHVIENHFYEVMQLCQAAIVTSGTATLETALLGVPMAIIYKMANSTYQIIKRIIKIPYIGLCNIVAGRHVVKEFIQQDANAENLAHEVIELINNQNYRNQMLNDLTEVKIKLGTQNKQIAAESVLKVLDNVIPA